MSCEKKHRNGETSYYHYMLGAAAVHLDHKVVIPLAPEPILKKDGSTKNDCERNASKRLLSDLRREHPHLKVMVVEDALASNQPHLCLLEQLKMKYMIGVKPGDHEFLFNWINALDTNNEVTHYELIDDQNTHHHFQWYGDVPLNDAHFEFRVNVLRYTQTKKNSKAQHFSWVTNDKITENNAFLLMKAGRSRWRIENETFNTLKNQGYHFEHNFGHGNENVCSVFTMLLLLAFLIDQVQQLCCSVYQQARKKVRVLATLFERVRSFIFVKRWENWNELYCFIFTPKGVP